jgi:hypothetical protein
MMPFLEAAAETTIVQLLRHKTTTKSAYATPKRRVFRREASFAIYASPQNSGNMPNYAGWLQKSPSLLQAHSTSISSKARQKFYVASAQIKVTNGGSGVPRPTIEFPEGYLFAVLQPDYELHGAGTEVVEEVHVLDGKKKTSPDK